MDAYVNLQPYTSDVQGFFPYIEELRTSVFRFEEDDMRYLCTVYSLRHSKYFK